MAGQAIATGFIAALGLAGCIAAEMPGASDGRALFAQNCTVCHGNDARGDGPMARSMSEPPKDLTLIEARHGGTFPRAKVLSIIDGYTRLDMPNMPEFGALLEGDLIPFDTGDGKMTPTPRKLVALVEYLESIQAER
ncbi:c-type cytochrome [Primorskyibacter flagellatus]|uniref:Cytochrome C oxidase, cbb3-type, subunit III n=1 Tax=Primorskyibacter flagellatus TaxID=1387277 RepID=A0A1W2ER48_9RHOB|nr:cytochrome c [Primorskyibacter flagellatus]SMD12161.1 Cytochrome C oxidase, cbb3-type, subunit III [Primorskyibacter flagellatus]